MKNLKVLGKYFLKYKWTIILGVFFIIASNITAVYIPLLIRDGIDELKNNVSQDKLFNYAVWIVVLAFVSGFFRVMIRQTIIVTSRKIEFDLRNDFWEHLQNLPASYYHNNKTGDIMAHATNDINAVRNFIGPAVMYTIDTLTTFIFTIVLMIAISPVLTLLALLPFPILSFIVYKVGKKIHNKFTLIQEHFSKLTAKAQENLSGIRIIKAYVREQKEIELFNELSKEYFKKNMNLARLQSVFFPLLFMLIGSSMVLILWFGGIKIMEGTLKIGELIAMEIYIGYLIWPAIAVGWVTNLVQQAEASQKRLNKIFEIKSQIVDNENTDYSISSLSGDIEIKELNFKYNENQDYILKDINLTIKEASTLAIVGPTGSGKSTLANLLLRIYDINEGSIRIGDKELKKIPLKVLRKSIGYVPQETFLFSDTIKNNILFGVDDYNEEELNHSIKIAQLEKDLSMFPQKLDTIIGERGITLSGGQKQRTSIARAIIKNPEILILDDCLSAVDTYTEEEILKNLKLEMQKRTSIIISHRISTIKDADKIIVLKEGRIIEEGTHEQLMNNNNYYSEMYKKQLLEQELEELA